MEMKNHLEHQHQLTLAREQCSQNPHLVKSFYTSMMTYPSNVDRGNCIDFNYFNPADQMPLINSAVPYIQQSVHGNESESQ
jgi:hypothetical protein